MDRRASLTVTSMEVPDLVLAAMEVHAANEAPLEACGLVAGSVDRVRFFYPLDNVAQSSDRYVVDPFGHGRALRHAELFGWDLVGVFHSHPSGPPAPSSTDVAEAFEPDWISFIAGAGDVRAWRLDGDLPREVAITVIATVDPSQANAVARAREAAAATLRRHAD